MVKPKTGREVAEAALGNKSQLPEISLPGYSIKRRVTTPLYSLTHNGPLYFRVEGEVVTGGMSAGRTDKDKPMAVVPVVNLETGEEVALICPTVLESALMRTPGGYVGKPFYAIQGPRAPGKRYFQIELFELSGEGKAHHVRSTSDKGE